MDVWLLREGPEFFNCVDGSTHHFTLVFNAFVFCQIFNEFNAREIGDDFRPLRNLLSSPMFLAVIITTVIGQYFIITYGGDFTSTVPLTQDEWTMSAMMGAASIPLGLFMRFIPISEAASSFAGVADGSKNTSSNNQSLLSKLYHLAIFVIPVTISFAVWKLAYNGEEINLEGLSRVLFHFAEKCFAFWERTEGEPGEL